LVGEELRLRRDDVDAAFCRQVFTRARVSLVGNREQGRMEQQLRGVLAGLSAQVLAQEGLDASRLAMLEAEVDLVGDLAELLGWALELPVLAVVQRRVGGDAAAPNLCDERELLGWVESYSEMLEQLGRDLLRLLRQWLET